MEPRPGSPPHGGDAGEACQVDQCPLPPTGAYAESIKAGSGESIWREENSGKPMGSQARFSMCLGMSARIT